MCEENPLISQVLDPVPGRLGGKDTQCHHAPIGGGSPAPNKIFFFGCLLGDQQEGDKYTAEPVVCHRCSSASTDFLNPHAPAHPKTMKCMRLNVEAAASGAHLKGSRGKWVVKLT